MKERPVRGVVAVATGTIAAVLVGVVATGFGTLPECGTGSYALWSLGPWFGVAEAAFFLTIIAIVAIARLSPAWWVAAAVVLVLAEAAAAWLGATASEAANGCTAWRQESNAGTAGWTAGVVSGVVAVVGLGVAGIIVAVRGPRRPEGPIPAAPSGARDAGTYRVQRSEVAGIRRGAAVRVALDAGIVHVLPAGGDPVRFERRFVAADLNGETTIVAVDRYLQLELRPLGDTEIIALIRALEQDSA